MIMKILVFGLGYVGLSNAFLLAQHHEVVCVDILQERVDQINRRELPIQDAKMEEFIKDPEISLLAVTDFMAHVPDSDYIIIATPTNFEVEKNYFDTSSVDSVIENVIKMKPNANIVIKSTLPIGYTDKICKKYQTRHIFFSPEFLREGKALYDNLYPSRIIVGTDSEEGYTFAKLLYEGAADRWKEEHTVENSIHTMTNTEAECVKLFSNTYLALRVAYFNELDTFCEINQLNTKHIIEAVGADPRIGSHYNNPSFGYGGYCLPKDTKQLLSEYREIPNRLIQAIVESNDVRKKHIADQILDKCPKKVGIYRLIMKSGSDNFRASAIFDIIKYLKKEKIDLVIYEPMQKSDSYEGIPIIKDLDVFMEQSDIILSNRVTEELLPAKKKVYTRDIFNRD